MQIKCCVCDKFAIWYYLPSDTNEDERLKFYCDDCINRGCSCNTIDPSGNNPEQYKDDLGRLLPCVEYICSDGYYAASSIEEWYTSYNDWEPYED